MENKIVIGAILFADIEGYSRITDDKLKEVVTGKLQDINSKFLNKGNHFYFNTWGDGIMICSYNPADLAEIALNTRDFIKTTTWKRFGFHEEPGIRIGLHLNKVTLQLNEEQKISNVFGAGVDLAARIEPVVELNKVFCSKRFYDHLLEEENLNIKGKYLGRKALAKNYGEMDLYELFWKHESDNEDDIITYEKRSILDEEIPLPVIPYATPKREFSNSEKNEFMLYSFNKIREYFLEGLEGLKVRYPRLKVIVRKSNPEKLICEIYHEGNLKTKSKIWLRRKSSSFTNNLNIAYTEDFKTPADDESYLYWITVGDNEKELFLNISRMGKFMNRAGYEATEQNAKETARTLWMKYMASLENS